MIAVKPPPTAMVFGEAPISISSRGARRAPDSPTTTASTTPRMISCTVARAAPSGSFCPMRRATTAAPPMHSPMASA